MNAFRLSGAVFFFAAVTGIGALLGSGAGCGTSITDIWECYSPDGGVLGLEPTDHPSQRPADCPCARNGPGGEGYTFPQGDCAWLDAGAEGGPIPGCNGSCVANAPITASDPVLVWIGAEDEAPSCPSTAAGVGYRGWAGLTSPVLPCPQCSCASSSGSCALPTSITASTSPCADAGASIAFGGPEGWDGGCTPYDATSGAVVSVSASPIVADDAGCTAMPIDAPGTEDLPGIWSTFALACTTKADGYCENTGKTCMPTAPSGFKVCVVLYDSEDECPDFGPYVERHVFYSGAMDDRACSPCGCTAEPGTCSATLAVYDNGTCDGAPLASATLSDTASVCVGFTSGTLGSKSIGPVTYSPGACTTADSEPMGTIVPTQPTAFCCISSP